MPRLLGNRVPRAWSVWNRSYVTTTKEAAGGALAVSFTHKMLARPDSYAADNAEVSVVPREIGQTGRLRPPSTHVAARQPWVPWRVCGLLQNLDLRKSNMEARCTPFWKTSY